jgi:hypothetical protein
VSGHLAAHSRPHFRALASLKGLRYVKRFSLSGTSEKRFTFMEKIIIDNAT